MPAGKSIKVVKRRLENGRKCIIFVCRKERISTPCVPSLFPSWQSAIYAADICTYSTAGMYILEKLQVFQSLLGLFPSRESPFPFRSRAFPLQADYGSALNLHKISTAERNAKTGILHQPLLSLQHTTCVAPPRSLFLIHGDTLMRSRLKAHKLPTLGKLYAPLEHNNTQVSSLAPNEEKRNRAEQPVFMLKGFRIFTARAPLHSSRTASYAE